MLRAQREFPPDNDDDQKRHDCVRDDNAQHVAEDADVKNDEEDHVEKDRHSRRDDALQGEKRGHAARSRVLREQRVDVRRKRVEDDQPHPALEIVDPVQQRKQRDNQRKACKNDVKAGDEHLTLIGVFVKREAENRVDDAEREQRHEQVCALGDHVGGAVFGGGKIARVQRHEQEHEQL